MKVYVDTSLLVKLYVPEPESARVTAFVTGQGRSIPYWVIHDLEIRNAFRLKLFRDELTEEELRNSLARLQEDLLAGRLFRAAVRWPSVTARALSLSERLTPEIGCRILDILHVAAAEELGCGRFLSNDARQRALAERIGMLTEW